MDYTTYTSVKNNFTATPNLCDLFKLLSVETWKRMEFAYIKKGVKVFETTITQNIIFAINAYNDQFGLNIEIYEAENESTNGNDFELIIRFPSDGVEYYAPIQAKKIYRSGKYDSMDHGDQIVSLLNYANARNAKPLYLLYNYSPDTNLLPAGFHSPIELAGCTMIDAEYLFQNHYNRRTDKNGNYRWLIPDFNGLNPLHAYAWHELVCPNTSNALEHKLQNFGNLGSAGFFPINTFKEDDSWINFKALKFNPDKGQFPSVFKEFSEKKERIFPDFLPQSRIVINKN